MFSLVLLNSPPCYFRVGRSCSATVSLRHLPFYTGRSWLVIGNLEFCILHHQNSRFTRNALEIWNFTPPLKQHLEWFDSECDRWTAVFMLETTAAVRTGRTEESCGLLHCFILRCLDSAEKAHMVARDAAGVRLCLFGILSSTYIQYSLSFAFTVALRDPASSRHVSMWRVFFCMYSVLHTPWSVKIAAVASSSEKPYQQSPDTLTCGLWLTPCLDARGGQFCTVPPRTL
jgi:hypothetical protein